MPAVRMTPSAGPKNKAQTKAAPHPIPLAATLCWDIRPCKPGLVEMFHPYSVPESGPNKEHPKVVAKPRRRNPIPVPYRWK